MTGWLAPRPPPFYIEMLSGWLLILQSMAAIAAGAADRAAGDLRSLDRITRSIEDDDLHRSLAALKRAPAVRRVVYRIYGNDGTAEAMRAAVTGNDGDRDHHREQSA